MLEPGVRQLLLEAFQPPTDRQLDWAVGTTYSLDLTALLMAPVAFAFSDCQDRDGKPLTDPLVLLRAVRQYADRICIFCQAGRILVPQSYQPLLSDLEDSIHESLAPGGGSFHAKTWLLRFSGADDVAYRFLCLSRNLTFDRSWDTIISLDGTLQDRRNAYGYNQPLGRFVETLPRMAIRQPSRVWKSRIEQLAYEVRRVDWELPEPFEEMAFWPLGLSKESPWPFPDRWGKKLVVSPFLDAALLNRLRGNGSKLQVVSRPESLDEVNSSALAPCKAIWILDDAADPEPDTLENDEAGDGGQPGSDRTDVKFTSTPLSGLHAKIFVTDNGWDSHVLAGSANATHAAFHNNVEFMVELIGKKSRCGVEVTLGKRSEEGRSRSAACLADLLQPYSIREQPEGVDEHTRAFERRVEELAKRLAGSGTKARCEAMGDADLYCVRLSGGQSISNEAIQGLTLRGRPVSWPKNRWHDLTPGEATWAAFEPVSLLGLTSFFAIEVVSDEDAMRRQFVLTCPLKNEPADRRERILRELLQDSDRVLRFLLLLLSNQGVRELGLLDESGGAGAEMHGAYGLLQEGTLFESLLRSLDRQPERIDDVASLVEELTQTAEGKELLPSDFECIWKPIWEARQAVKSSPPSD